jgi:hypothetical protein
MSQIKHSVGIALFWSLLAVVAYAGDYSVAVDDPVIGSSIPSRRVSLGVEVDIDRSWNDLSEREQLLWRKFVDLPDPRVTPPFPTPSIRSLLRKLRVPERFRTTERIVREERLLLMVRLTWEGVVDRVEIMSGTEPGSTKLNEGEGVLAYMWTNALMTTRFTPAMLDGNPMPSAFPLPIGSVVHLR